MQTEESGGEKGLKLYLGEDDWNLLMTHFKDALYEFHDGDPTDPEAHYNAVRFMGLSGGRRESAITARRGEFFQPVATDHDLWFIKLQLKDTTSRDTEGKRRDAWIPKDFKRDLDEYFDERDIAPGDEFYPFSKKTLNNKCEYVGEYLANLTGNSDWADFSPHDCRRYFACHMSRMNVNPEIAMTLGGWETYKQYQEYVKVKSKQEIEQELIESGLARDVEYVPLREKMDRVISELKDLKEREQLVSQTHTTSGEFDENLLRQYHCPYCNAREQVPPEAVREVELGKVIELACPNCQQVNIETTSY